MNKLIFGSLTCLFVVASISYAEVPCADAIKKMAEQKAEKSFGFRTCIAHEPVLGSQKPGERGYSGTVAGECKRYLGTGKSQIRQPFQFEFKVEGNDCGSDVKVTDN